ncbi:MAG: tRNA preQ1(34) S-adenosylmethionine ribosyltransferase-isomerase QueA [Deltaproteobacteria bacterium]|nr:tRNA preQ1(34) S-adenosylmethionine ribosyltransferase-isomerase QueA [Deltaproteobacteria bacterium]
MFSIDDYNYDLQEELIAQAPVSDRETSRLLFIERTRESLSDYHFYDLPGLLMPGDLLVVNNTRVVPAKLFGRKESGGKVEVLVLRNPETNGLKSNTRWCLVKSSKRPRIGGLLFFEKNVTGQVKKIGDGGLVMISFYGDFSIDSLIKDCGYMPLPPYIKRGGENGQDQIDRERYQTVYARENGAVAAPTAGLHFTVGLIERLAKKGISMVEVTLHVGHGTFRPVRTEDIRDHEIGDEWYRIDPETTDYINRAKEEGRRIIAVGTTVVRTLESVATKDSKIFPSAGSTKLLIYPGYEFKIVDGLITNFHLPKSSLLFLVSAFGGFDLIKKAYRSAVEKRYRFYSYGDAMLIT